MKASHDGLTLKQRLWSRTRFAASGCIEYTGTVNPKSGYGQITESLPDRRIGMMNQEIKAKWVAALRSGEYQQGTDVLRNEDNTYCCLGVLCDLAGQEGVGKWTPDNYFIDSSGSKGIALIPGMVEEWAGLTNWSPTVVAPDGIYELAVLNDTGSTFGEIADLIEAQL